LALADSARAIGAVTNALIERLSARTGLTVVSGRPEQGANAGQRLNLFLYETAFDPHLKNQPLDEGQKPPVWLVLKYLLTAFDDGGNSDSADAHEALGAGIRALYESDLLRLDGLAAPVVQALGDNPDELRITFDESPVELLSKVMQGSDESYRLSIAFQVRPVMIASGAPPAYTLLVGVDYTQAPPVERADTYKGVQIDVIPSLGSRITEGDPIGFEIGDEVALKGEDLHLSGLSVRLGPVELPVTMQQPDELRFIVNSSIVNGNTISAGSHPISVVQTLSLGRVRTSNLLIGNLLPTLTNAAIVSPVSVVPPPPGPPPPVPPPQMVFATIELTGELLGLNSGEILGRNADDAFMALYRDGRVARMFDVFTAPPAPPPIPQQQRRIVMQASDAVPEGEYLVILKVNGQQALMSFPVNLAP
jgi:hypothetical protein